MNQLINTVGSILLATAYISIPVIVTYSAYVIHLQRKKRDAQTPESDDESTVVEDVTGHGTSVELPDIELKDLKRCSSMPSLHSREDNEFVTTKDVETSDDVESSDVESSNDQAHFYGYGVHTLQSVVAASTCDMMLSFVTEGTSIDNIDLFNGDRVLLKNQSDPSENGIYVVKSGGAPPIRASDFMEGLDTAGCYVFVENGSKFGSTGWIARKDSGVIGKDPVYFAEFSGTPRH